MAITDYPILYQTESLSSTGSPTFLFDGSTLALSATNVSLSSTNGVVVGDTSNNVTIDSVSAVRLYGSTTVYDDVRVALDAVKLTGTNSPTYERVLGDGGDPASVGVFLYKFSNAKINEVFFTVQMPHARKNGTDVFPHVHWMPSDATNGTLKMGLEYTWANVDSTFADTQIIYGQDDADGALKHQILPFDAIAGGDKTISSMLICRLFRDPTDGGDSYNNDVWVLEFDLHVEIDSLGSNSEYIK